MTQQNQVRGSKIKKLAIQVDKIMVRVHLLGSNKSKFRQVHPLKSVDKHGLTYIHIHPHSLTKSSEQNCRTSLSMYSNLRNPSL